MAYIGSSINESPVIAGIATAAIGTAELGAEFRAVKFDSEGGIVLADTAGENVLGLLIAEMCEIIDADSTVTVQIKDGGLWKTGAAVAVGDELTTDADGKCVTAASGDFITAIALEAADAADEVIKVQIAKCGYKA